MRLRGRFIVINLTVSEGVYAEGALNISSTFFLLPLSKTGLPVSEKKFLFDYHWEREDPRLPVSLNGVKDFQLDENKQQILVFCMKDFEAHYELRSMATGDLLIDLLVDDDTTPGVIRIMQFETIVYSGGLLITGQGSKRLR